MSSPDRRAVDLARRVYRAAAISNGLVTVPAFVAYRRYVGSFLPKPPRYPFLVWIWSGMAALWGVTFLEISRDPVRSYPLIKYSYLEKMVTSASVIVAYRRGNVPKRVLAATVVTDIAWIPVFVAVHAALSRSLERAPA
jgi:hypothetical protein